MHDGSFQSRVCLTLSVVLILTHPLMTGGFSGLHSKGQKGCSVNLAMLEEQNSAAKWFTEDFPQGEDHREIMLHIHRGQVKRVSAGSDNELCGQ